jgi:hypothetical protein
MVEVMKGSATGTYIRASIKMEKFQAKVFISGLMGKYTMECG